MRTTAPRTAPRTGSTTRRGVALALAAALAVAACGSDDDSSDGSDAGGAPTTTDPDSEAPAPGDADLPLLEGDESAQPLPADGDRLDGDGSAPAGDSGDEAGPPAGLAAVQPVSVTGAPLPPFDPNATDPTIGAAAPVVTGATFEGDEQILGAATGSPSMLVFLAHWCPACNAEVPELVSLADGGLPDDLQVVGVSTAVASDRDNFPPYEWLDGFGWPYDTFADDELSTAFQAFGGPAFPYVVIVDGDGTVLARKAGQSSAADIEAFVDSVLT